MCLILFAWQAHPDYPLVLAANRDEFYRRPSLALAQWDDAPGVFGGRDVQAGGGWLACCADGRFAAVTNVRQGVAVQTGVKSRGRLVADYLRGKLSSAEFATTVVGGEYDGFNLLLGDQRELYYLSNRNGVAVQPLPPGIYGLSNHRLDTAWPKVVRAKAAFTAALPTLPDGEAFFRVLGDRAIAADADLPATGVTLALERMLSAVFIASADYGTRASTLLRAQRGEQMVMTERRFGAAGVVLGETTVTVA
jgi:uncharacterized protein with NRDE domain